MIIAENCGVSRLNSIYLNTPIIPGTNLERGLLANKIENKQI